MLYTVNSDHKTCQTSLVPCSSLDALTTELLEL